MIRQEASNVKKILTLGYYWSYDENNNFEIQTSQNLGISKNVQQFTRSGEFIQEFESCGKAAAAVNGTHSHSSECCRGKIKSYKGYIWKYS